MRVCVIASDHTRLSCTAVYIRYRCYRNWATWLQKWP